MSVGGFKEIGTIRTAEETFFQKEVRLKTRKRVYVATYKKGLFMVNKEQLCAWIMQEDVLIRINKAGILDDDTEFSNITIEGFKP